MHDIKKTAASYEKVNAKAKQANKTLRSKALKNAAKDANKASSSINRLSQRFAGLVAASVGLYSIKRAIGGILGTGDKFERLSVQLEAITGSMAEGDRALAWVKEFTKNTPYQLHEVAESFVRLKAFGLDPMDGSMQAVVDQASLLGGGFDRLRGISVGLGQAWAKQRLQGEEILQLVERGIPVWEHLGKITGKSALEIRKLSEAGKLGRDVIADLIKEIGKSADGAALKNMSLLSGYVSNLKDSWSYFLAEIAESGALDYAKNELKKLSEQISIMNANGSLSKLATSISNGFISMAETIKGAFADVTFEGFVANVTTSFNRVNQAFLTLQNGFTLASNSLSIFFNGFTAGVKIWGAATAAQFFLITKAAQKLFESLGADKTAERFKGYSEFMKQTTKAFAAEVVKDANDIKSAWNGIYDGLAEKSQVANEKAKRYNMATIDQILDYYPKVEAAVKKTAETAQAAFADAADALKQIDASGNPNGTG